MRIGCDLVSINDFRKNLERGGQKFLETIFRPAELENNSIEHLAGIFAAKEAIIKCLEEKPNSWLEIEIAYYETGRPKCDLVTDLSISQTNKYAFAVACRNF